jgi:hypothetical protein
VGEAPFQQRCEFEGGIDIEEKHERYKHYLDVQSDMMKSDKEKARGRLVIEEERMKMEKIKTWTICSLRRRMRWATLRLRKEVRLARFTNEPRIMLLDTSLMDDDAKEWITTVCKDINARVQKKLDSFDIVDE